MSEFKGTEGYYISNQYLKDENNEIIADLYINDEKDRANALLISKAPEMLQMLNNIYDLIEFLDEWEEERLKIEQLIKQATDI